MIHSLFVQVLLSANAAKSHPEPVPDKDTSMFALQVIIKLSILSRRVSRVAISVYKCYLCLPAKLEPRAQDRLKTDLNSTARRLVKVLLRKTS